MITQQATKIRHFAFGFALLALMSACGSQPATSSAPAGKPRVLVTDPGTSQRSIAVAAANVAFQQVGVPYLYGGASPNGFDCSGLVQYAYGAAGKNLPRTTGQLWSATQTIEGNEIRIGDLLFFSIEGKMSHVGIYLGHGQFVHAPSSGRTVTVANLHSPFYEDAFLRAGRPR